MASRRQRPSIDDIVRDVVAAEAEPGAHLDHAVVALKLSEAAERYARAEVIAARELDGASWAAVGKALGVSRQTAHERFRTGPDGLHSRLFKRSETE
ncbi:MAG: helix-turn-helix domain-containing protein [Acidimicrobiales bacterium]